MRTFFTAPKWMAALACGSLLLCGCASSSVVLDTDGKPVNPFAEKSAATVLIFVSNDCPISNRYLPEILRLRDTYAARGVNFWMVHADAEETAASIRDHDLKFHLTIPSLRDPRHNLLKKSDAEVTPTAALFAANGKLVYHGRIDDRVAALEHERPTPTHRDLAEALDAVLSARPVPVSATPAIGCFIPGAK